MTLTLEPPPIEVTRSPTAEELRRLMNEAGVEFVDGRLVESMMSRDSAGVTMRISVRLGAAAEREDCAAFTESLCYRCFEESPSRYRKPDASVIRKTRLDALGPADLGMMPIAPDLAVEVVSPGDDADELDEKIAEYLSNGFGQVWVVFPPTRTIYVHKPDGSVIKYTGEQEITAPEVLPSFRCKASEFFA